MTCSSEPFEACPHCGSAGRIKSKLVLIDRLDPARAGDETRTWESACAGGVSVTDLKPNFVVSGPIGQLIPGLYCERCDLGYLPESAMKPARPQSSGATSGAPNSTAEEASPRVSPDPVGAVIDEVDVSRTGNELLQRHGRGAHIVAATNAEGAGDAGDLGAARFWRRVTSSIKPR
jgi:hypothetical protein